MLFEELSDNDVRLEPVRQLEASRKDPGRYGQAEQPDSEPEFAFKKEQELEEAAAGFRKPGKAAPAGAVSQLDSLKFDIQEEAPAGTRIKVIGVGGGGCDAAGRMYQDGVPGVEFYAINTDQQALAASPIPNKILIGQKVTGGLGAGADPNVGKEAALEDTERIIEILEGADMVFVAAGMGGGTGTGAAPVVASLAKELNALTVAIVTKPFVFEGARRARVAEKGIEDLAATVDALIQIPNERLTSLMPKGTSLLDSFRATDDVLRQAVVGISDIMRTPGLINRDFADIRAIMQGMGYAMMGTASARGENAAVEAARKAIRCPMLEGGDIQGARAVLINITAGSQLSLHDIHEACTLIRTSTGNEDVQVNFGVVLDEKRGDEVKVTVIATGFQKHAKPEERPEQPSRVSYFTPPLLPSAASPPPLTGESLATMPSMSLDIQADSSLHTLAASTAAPQLPPSLPVAGPGNASGYQTSTPAEPPHAQEEVDIPAFLRRDRKWFS